MDVIYPFVVGIAAGTRIYKECKEEELRVIESGRKRGT